jgi:hypothetical protein
VARYAPLAIAAALMAAVWRPGVAPTPETHNAGSAPAGRSWFSPPPSGGDVFGASSAFERPRIRLDDADRDWVLVPGEHPGELLVVEIKRIKSRTIPLHGDF